MDDCANCPLMLGCADRCARKAAADHAEAERRGQLSIDFAAPDEPRVECAKPRRGKRRGFTSQHHIGQDAA